MKKEIKVKVTFSEGYEDRFTKACIAVAKKRIENEQKEMFQKNSGKERKAG